MKSLEDSFIEGRRLILIGVFLNIVLAAAKFVGGVVGNSSALMADGLESTLDVLSSGMMWAALKYAERPADHDHPYGHGKMESLAAVAGSLLLLGAGGALGIRSLFEIVSSWSQVPVAADLPRPFTLGILLGTIAIKEGLFRLFQWRGASIGSTALAADAWHHRSDAITSLAALAGIGIALLGGPAWASADDWAALFSCGIIVFNGLRMLGSALGEAMDKQEPAAIRDGISLLAAKVSGVTSIEKIRVRKSGLSRIADLHVRVAGDKTVREGHAISHDVKDTLQKGGFNLSDVTVHIEPERESSKDPSDR
jgi:cation diffusion facilitator family transporter